MLCKISNFYKTLVRLLNLNVFVSIEWAGIFLIKFSKYLIFYTKFSKKFKKTI